MADDMLNEQLATDAQPYKRFDPKGGLRDGSPEERALMTRAAREVAPSSMGSSPAIEAAVAALGAPDGRRRERRVEAVTQAGFMAHLHGGPFHGQVRALLHPLESLSLAVVLEAHSHQLQAPPVQVHSYRLMHEWGFRSGDFEYEGLW